MPATRSASTVAHPRTAEPYNKPSHNASRMPDSDVIIISSDEEDAAVVPKRRAVARASKKTRTSKEVIDITSTSTSTDKSRRGESSRSTSQAKADAKELARQQETLARYEKELERSQAEIAKLKTELATEKAKAKATSRGDLSISIDSLDELATCEICTCRMWKSATLSDCGHTFCQGCLTDWFSTILAQHLTNNPHFDHNRPPPRVDPALLGALPGALHPFILNVMQNNSRPAYSCPTCRVAVQNRPVEVFALKNLVQSVAEAKGEQPPPAAQAPAPGRSTRGRAAPPPPRAENPWDGFFGKR